MTRSRRANEAVPMTRITVDGEPLTGRDGQTIAGILIAAGHRSWRRAPSGAPRGVFCGIGEFTVHKEFVSSKISGTVPSLYDPALDRIFDFAGEVGLVVDIHNDMDVPFPKEGENPAYLEAMRALVKRHPHTTVIWSHLGVGRVVDPVENHLRVVANLLEDPALKNLYFDISWSEVAKYVNTNQDTLARTAALLNRYPDRFLYGSDALAPKDQGQLLETYELFQPLFRLLHEEARQKIKKGNYARLFDQACGMVRAWEKSHPREL